MDGPVHYRKAEELAAKAAEYLGRDGGQDTAAAWAAIAQVHATLALATAARASTPGPRRRKKGSNSDGTTAGTTRTCCSSRSPKTRPRGAPPAAGRTLAFPPASTPPPG
jgi:hypothetical protein